MDYVYIFIYKDLVFVDIYLVKNDYSFDLKLIFYYIKFVSYESILFNCIKFVSYESIEKYLIFVFNDNIVEMVKNRGSIEKFFGIFFKIIIILFKLIRYIGWLFFILIKLVLMLYIIKNKCILGMVVICMIKYGI